MVPKFLILYSWFVCMIYLLYGPDTYRSRKKLKELTEEYRRKSGLGLNTHRFDAEEHNSSQLREALRSGSLFGSRKLVVAYGVFSRDDGCDVLAQEAPHLASSKNTILFLWEGVFDESAKKRLTSLAPHIAKSQEFKALKPAELTQFIRHEARARGVSLVPQDLFYLSLLGSDLWAITNELEKMAVSGHRKDGVAAKVSGREPTIFDLGDSFFSMPIQALCHLLRFIGRGEDEFSIFSYLANYSRTLVVVKNYLERGAAVPQNTGIHPFVVKKTSVLVRDIPSARLHSSLAAFFEEDKKIKTGESSPRDSLTRVLVAHAAKS